MKLVRISAVALLVLAVAALAGVGVPEAAQGQEPGAAGGGITVNGTGSVATTPDIAQISFGVVSQAQTARAALTANAAAARKIVAALRAAGIPAADIQTQQASLEPRSNETTREIAGYTATTMVATTIRNLARVPAIVDAAVAADANLVFGPFLTRSNASALYNDAMRAAVADARRKAGLLADASDVTLGEPTAVVETGAAPVDEKASLRAGDAAGSAIEPGTQQIVASVTVTFEIR
jgi:uncharacterized protein YggE